VIDVPPIIDAVEHGDAEAVRAILHADPAQAHATVRATNWGANTALHAAAIRELIDIAELLIQYGANVDAPGLMGLTPLHEAANRGHVEFVELLLRHGANVNVEDYCHFRPLHLCTPGQDRRCPEVARLLLEHGAHQALRHAQSKSDTTQYSSPRVEAPVSYTPPIITAVEHEDAEAVKAILLADPAQVHATFRATNYGPDTALHAAASRGLIAIGELLVQYGADVNARGDREFTPLHEAANNGHVEFVELLLCHGANVDADNNFHIRPLHLCTPGRDRRCPEVARLLLKHGAQVDLHSAMGLLDADRVRQILRDNPNAVAEDPRSTDLLTGAVGMLLGKLDKGLKERGYNTFDEQHMAIEQWKEISQQIVTDNIDILRELTARGVPAIGTPGEWALVSTLKIADVRVTRLLLEYGVPKPDKRGGLMLLMKRHLSENPYRDELVALLRQYGID
jgi:ankyrin repeat protein